MGLKIPGFLKYTAFCMPKTRPGGWWPRRTVDENRFTKETLASDDSPTQIPTNRLQPWFPSGANGFRPSLG